jgi:glycosyltransferase involved in cell wall biosynthesis
MNEQLAPGPARPAVTVIIPTFNRAAIVGRAIRSVLAQTWQDWELIVVDDCSRDGTEQAVRSFSDHRIKYICQDRNRGAGAARNTGIRCARGEYVAFLDSDDEWLPQKLQKELEVFRHSDGEVGLVYSGKVILDERGKVLRVRMETQSGWVYEGLLDQDFIGSCSRVMVKKEVLDRVWGFDEALPSGEDRDLWLRVARVSKVASVPFCLVRRHMGSDQISASLRNICAGRERILAKYRSEMKPRTVALNISRIAPLLFNYEPRRARAMAWEGLRLWPLQRALLGALAVSTVGMGGYRWVFRKMAKWRDRYCLGRARI